MSQFSSYVSVVILNYNGKKWLEQFLPSVVKYSCEAEIVVADNRSTDDSLEYVKNNFPTVRLVVLDKNYGFTGGYNRAIKEITRPISVLLNSDIEVTENWLDAPARILLENQSAAACQPKIRSFNRKEYFEHAGAAGGMLDLLGYPFCRGRIFMTTEKDEGQYDDSCKVFWATGAAMFIKTDLFIKFRGFQEEFFAHMEEIDLCWRLQNSGYEIHYEPNSVVYHVGGGTLSVQNPKKTFLNFRNGLSMLYMNIPSRYLFILLFFRLLLDGVAGLQFLLVGHWKDTLAVLKAHFSFYKQFGTWNQERKIRKNEWIKEAYQRSANKSIVWNYFIRGNKTYKNIFYKS